MATHRFFNPTDSEAVHKWDKSTSMEVPRRSFLQSFGTGISSSKPGSIIRIFDEYNSSAMADVTTTFARRMAQEPAGGLPDNLSGTGEALRTATDVLSFGPVRIAGDMSDPISQIYVDIDIARTTYTNMTIHAGVINDAALVMHACGYTATAGVNQYSVTGGYKPHAGKLTMVGHNATIAPDARHHWRPNGLTTDAAVAADDTAKFDLDMIDELMLYNQMLPNPVSPVRIMGGEYFVMPIHPICFRDLRKSDTRFYKLVTDAIQGGKWEDNAITKPQLFAYGNVLMWVTEYVPPGVTSGAAQINTRRLALMGADAVHMVHMKPREGERYTWSFEKSNHGYQTEAGLTWYPGIKKVRYEIDGTDMDFGVIAATVYAKDETAWS